jgi:hypothetical protein
MLTFCERRRLVVSMREMIGDIPKRLSRMRHGIPDH